MMASEKKRFESWGRYPVAEHVDALNIREDFDWSQLKSGINYLPRGLGRSYGDSCLNEKGGLLLSTEMNRILSFDKATGEIECQAGVSFGEIIKEVLPEGWFLPVTPGTQFVTLAGAIANDVHGKNHHVAGCFGRWIKSILLARSDGSIRECRPDQNSELFEATIGGLGLTGTILSARFQLIPFKSSQLEVERIRFQSLEEYLELSADSDASFEYVVSWMDTLSKSGKERGVLMRANAPSNTGPVDLNQKSWVGVPFSIPSVALNKFSIGIFNKAYYAQFPSKPSLKMQHYRPYFYPLDAIANWNRIYGRRGLLQFQMVIPHNNGIKNLRRVFKECDRVGQASFLTVLKTFGNLDSPGMLSFPRSGITLNLDFANKGESSIELLTTLDALVRDMGGAVYPAKDATMSPQSFKNYFPRWEEFSAHVDPRLSSSFWRRVTSDHEPK